MPGEARDLHEWCLSLLSLSGDGVARFEVVRPLLVSAPEDEQVEHLLRYTRLCDCNERCTELYGQSRQEMVGRPLQDLVPRDPPRLQRIRDFVRGAYRLRPGDERQLLYGTTPRWTLVSGLGKVVEGRLEEFWVCLRDTTARKEAELGRERQGRILEAVAHSAVRLLLPGSWRERTEEVLARLGEAFQVARVSLLQLDRSAGDPPRLVFRAVWALPGHELSLEDRRIREGLSANETWLGQLGAELRAGRVVSTLVRDIPEPTRGFSEALGARSFAVVPIFTSDRLWGFLGFSETRYERVWTGAEIDSLQALGAVLGAAIERESADEVLRESEERFKRLAAAAFEGVAVTDGGVFIDGNDQLADMLGGPLTELLGRPVQDFVAPEDLELVRSRMASGVEGPYLHLARRSDGSSFPVEVRARSLPYRGRTVRVTALRDVSARVQAEERQQRLEAELRQAAREWGQTFDAIDLGIVLADAQARVIRMNRGALAVAPSRLGDAPGLALSALSEREPWHTLLEVHREVGASRNSVVAEAREPSTGRDFYLLGSPWYQASGEPPWRVLTFRDVTDFTRMQEELRQARVMEAMGSLVAGVAHEVRNPLFSISATIDAIESTSGRSSGLEEQMALLRSQVGRLTQLTRDLLDYGRPSALQKTPTNLAAVVRRAVRACSTLLRQKEITVEEQLDPGLPRLDIDGARVEQALENLLANAVQHAPARSLVRLSAEPIEAGGRSFVRCVVEDQGPGLPPESLEQVFEPFFTRRKGGTGLGLAIVRRVVEGHGGRVVAENREQGGARFAVWLPVEHVEQGSERG